MLTSNGPAIKALREVKGWGSRTFAAESGISHGYLSNIENPDRRHRATGELLETFARLLEVPVAVIGYECDCRRKCPGGKRTASAA